METFLIVGMAGSGKSTFSQRLYTWLSEGDNLLIDKNSCLNSNITSINLDPAAIKVNMPLNVDIREYFDYENVMETYNIGPNGAVTTIINFFLLNWDVSIKGRYAIIDTPGQIEAFVWSSAGKALVDKLLHNDLETHSEDEMAENKKVKCPSDEKDKTKQMVHKNNVILLYLIDSMECKKPTVFMCNMLYALILRLRFNIPILVVFNKIDIAPMPATWIEDYESFIKDVNCDDMCGSLLSSMALYFEEYYNSFDYVGVSAISGAGKTAFFDVLNKLINNSKMSLLSISKNNV